MPPIVPVFEPARGLSNPHVQTLWGPLWRTPPRLERQRQRLWLADGDFLDLDWHCASRGSAALVLVLHGLTGSADSPYVLGLQQALHAQGWNSVALNWRGCSGEPNRLARSYHSGASEDLAEVVAHLRAARPQTPLYAVGYSLGGNVLLKYLGERAEGSQLTAAVAVSVPFRLDHCADRIGTGFSKVYQAHFMRAMRRYVEDKQRCFQRTGATDALASLQRLGTLRHLKTFWEFDGQVTAPLNGFMDVHDYYRRASSHYYLGASRTPTLLIQSKDDPFVAEHSLPRSHDLPSNTCFELHAKGSHVGFVEGRLGRPGYYLERRIPQWLADGI